MSSKKELQNINHAMFVSTQNSLAEMAFLDVDTAEPFDEPIHQVVSIQLQAPLNGLMVFYFYKEVEKLLIGNIYGTDEVESESYRFEDCLLEIANIITGAFLKELFHNNRKENHFALPKIEFNLESLPLYDHIDHFYYDLEGVPFKISLHYNNIKI